MTSGKWFVRTNYIVTPSPLHSFTPLSKIEQTVRNNSRTQQLLAWAERVSPPGFDGITLRETGRNFLLRLKVGKLNVRSAAVTYNLLMAIPPTLLILFSLVPYLPLQNVQEAIVETVPVLVSNPSLSQSMQHVIVDFMNTERGDLLSFGILLTAFFSSNGMMGLMRSFDDQTPVHRPRKGLARRLTAIKLTFILMGTVLLTLAALLVRGRVLERLSIPFVRSSFLLQAAATLLVVLLVFVSISIIYTYGPSLKRKSHFISPGSVGATVLCMAATEVFFYLVDNFIHYNKVYGSVGTIIAFMAWVYINTLVILLGYELNVSILLGLAKEDKPQTVRVV